MHHYSPILAPVVALVAWTLLVMLWMVVTRFGEFRRMGVTFSNIPPGARRRPRRQGRGQRDVEIP